MPPATANPPTHPEISTHRNGDAPGGTPFYVTGGTLPPSAPSYIVRQADTDLYDALQDGQFCYVLNTRQIGKSSLMIRTVRRLKENGAAVVVLDLTAVGQNLTAEQWYDGLLVMLGEQLHMEDECDDFWTESDNLGPMQRFFAALAQCVLPNIAKERSLILFVDEIDSVRSLPFSADEFFAGIRECYNRRVQTPEYNRLTFCLLGVATPADLIQDTRISPFNIGRRVTLRDFSESEGAPLASGMGPNGKNLLARALYWTGGHPYLTQRLCREISRENAQSVADVDKLCERLFLSKRALDSDDNLSFVQNRMLRSEFPLADVLDFYGKLRAGKKIRDDETNPLCGLLRLAGIAAVDERNDTLRLRNRIYATVFDKEWVLKNMPDAELRRQRQAAWAAYLRSGIIAAAVFALMGVMLVKLKQAVDEAHVSERIATQQKQNAEQLRRKAESSEQAALEAQKKERESADKAKRDEMKALIAKREADIQRSVADTQRSVAESQSKIAKAQSKLAKDQSERADNEAKKADDEATKALQAANSARNSEQIAKAQRQVAQDERKKAEEARKSAENEANNAKIAKANAERATLDAQKALDRLRDANKKRITRLKNAENSDPRDITAATELARIYLDDEDYAKALDEYNVILRRKPDQYAAYSDRGYCNYKLGADHLTDAIRDYTVYLEHNPGKDAEPFYLDRAMAYCDDGNYAAALKDLSVIQKSSALPIEYYIFKGRSLVGLHQYDMAVEAFSHLLADPTNTATVDVGHIWIADARRQQGNYEAAYASYVLYQQQHPDFAPIYEPMIQCAAELNHWDEVLKQCVRFRQAAPTSAKVNLWRAYAYLNTNDLTAYRAVCKESMARFGTPDATAENANLAAWTCALGPRGITDYTVALQIAGRAVAEAQKQVDRTGGKDEGALGDLWANRNTVAALIYRAGRYTEAIHELEACEAMPRSFQPSDRFGDYILLSLANAGAGDRSTAESWLRKARESAPTPSVEQRIFLKEAESALGRHG